MRTNLFKGFIALLSLSFIVGILSIVFNSCNNDETPITSVESKQFLLKYEQYLPALNEAKLFSRYDNGGSRTLSLEADTSQIKTLVITTPLPVPPKFRDVVLNASTLPEIMEAKLSLDAHFTLYDTPSWQMPLDEMTMVVKVSESETKKALNPLVQESKKYLYERGFSEQEIQSMLKSENADETALVPLVLAATESESRYMASASHSAFIGWPMKCYAAEVNLDAALNCAIRAVGIDAIASLEPSKNKKWTKVALKKMFKTVAKRFLGPVGVALAVVEFGLCMNDVE